MSNEKPKAIDDSGKHLEQSEVENAFLSLLSKDIDSGNVVPLNQSLLDEIANLVGDIEVDLDGDIEGEVAIG